MKESRHLREGDKGGKDCDVDKGAESVEAMDKKREGEGEQRWSQSNPQSSFGHTSLCRYESRREQVARKEQEVRTVSSKRDKKHRDKTGHFYSTRVSSRQND